MSCVESNGGIGCVQTLAVRSRAKYRLQKLVSVSQNVSISREDGRASPEEERTQPVDTGEFTDQFIKKYLRIQLNKDESFDERTSFDLYKRRSKMGKYEALLAQLKPRLPKAVLDARFSRLFKDSVRRKDVTSRVEADKDIELKRTTSPSKSKIIDNRRVYEENMEKKRKRDAMVEEKRKMKEFEEEMKVVVQNAEHRAKVKNFYKHHRPYSYKESPRLVERMDADIKRREEQFEEIRKEKEIFENAEMEEYFVPKVNKVIVSGQTHTKSGVNTKNRMKAHERLVKDANLRKVKEMLREVARNRVERVAKNENMILPREEKAKATRIHRECCDNRGRNAEVEASTSKDKTRYFSPSEISIRKPKKDGEGRSASRSRRKLGNIAEVEERSTPSQTRKRNDVKNSRFSAKKTREMKSGEDGSFIIRPKAEKIIEEMYKQIK